MSKRASYAEIINDWPTFFSAGSSKDLALPALPQTNFEEGIVCGQIIYASDLNALLRTTKETGARLPRILTLMCDVLVVDESIILSFTTYIFARRIQTDEDHHLSVDARADSKITLKIATQEVAKDASNNRGRLKVVTLSVDSAKANQRLTHYVSTGYPRPPLEDIDPKNRIKRFPICTGFSIEMNNPVTTTLPCADIASAMLKPGKDLPYFLKVQALLASRYIDKHRDYAMQVFQWIEALTAGSEHFIDLGFKAQSLFATARDLSQESKGSYVIPTLDHRIYAESAKLCMDILKNREDRFNALLAIEHNDKNWQKTIRLSVLNSENEENLHGYLVEKAEADLKAVSNARVAAMLEVVEQKDRIVILKKNFSDGVDRWKKKNTDKAILDIFKNIFDLLVQLPEIIATGADLGNVLSFETFAEVIQSIWPNDVVDRPNPPNRERLLQAEDAMGEFVRAIESIERDAEERGLSQEIKDQSIEGVFEIFSAEIDDLQSQTLADTGRQDAYLSEVQARLNLRKDRRDKQKALRTALNSAAGSVKGIATAAMRIGQIEAAADAMQSNGAQILGQIRAGVNKSLQTVEPVGIDIVTGGAQVWDQLKISIESAFGTDVKSQMREVDGAQEYLDGFRILIAKSRSMSAARLALVKANSDLANAILRQRAANDSVKIFEQQLRDSDITLREDRDLIAAAYECVLDCRLSVFMALETYRRSFAYYALLPRAKWPGLPDISLSIDQGLDQEIYNVTRREFTEGTLISNDLEPSTLDGEEVRITDTDIIDSLKNHPEKKIVVNIPLINQNPQINTTSLEGKSRIRVHEVVIEFEGLKTSKKIRVDILTSGIYRDKFKGGGSKKLSKNNTHSFISKPWRKTMTCTVNPLVITGHADVDDEHRGLYFMPTPFTTWTLGVSAVDGTPLDLKDVEAIVFKFYGQFSQV